MRTIEDQAESIWYSLGYFAEQWQPKPFVNGPLVGYGVATYYDFRHEAGWRSVVVHLASNCSIACATSKSEAMEYARANVTHPQLPDLLSAYRSIRDRETARIAKLRGHGSIPKRRREIFDKSQGKCHYCATPLTLDGKWHIEHMQPKALLGPNDKSNLVASCVPCNMKKRDMTAEEFIAQRQA